jgi:uncharacterized protein (TIGR02466 family)
MIHKIYPTHLYKTNLNEGENIVTDNELLLYKKWIYDFRENSIRKQNHFLVPNSFSTHSFNKKLHNEKLFEPLAEKILFHTYKYFQLYVKDVDINLYNNFNFNKVEFKIDEMWANIYPKGGSVREHIHAYTTFAGVFNLQVPKDSQTYFIDPLEYHKMAGLEEWLGIKNNCKFSDPKEKDLYMWPGYVKHGAEVNQNEEDKIIISFNIRLANYH